MDRIIDVTFKVRGTEKEIEKVKARIAVLMSCEEVVSLHFKRDYKVWEEEKEEK